MRASMKRSVRRMKRSVRNAVNRPVQRRNLHEYNVKNDLVSRISGTPEGISVHGAALQAAQGPLVGVTAATRAIGDERFKQTLEALARAHPELSDDDLQRFAHDAVERATQKAYARFKAAESASSRGRLKALTDAVERVKRTHRIREGHREIGLAPITTQDSKMLDDLVTVSQARPRTAMETSAAEGRLSRSVSGRRLAKWTALGRAPAARRKTPRPAVSRSGTAIAGADRDTRRSPRVRRRRRTRSRVLKSQARRAPKRKTGRRVGRK